VDEVRRQEQQSRPELKRTRYIWLKTPRISRRNRRQPWSLLRSRSRYVFILGSSDIFVGKMRDSKAPRARIKLGQLSVNEAKCRNINNIQNIQLQPSFKNLHRRFLYCLIKVTILQVYPLKTRKSLILFAGLLLTKLAPCVIRNFPDIF